MLLCGSQLRHLHAIVCMQFRLPYIQSLESDLPLYCYKILLGKSYEDLVATHILIKESVRKSQLVLLPLLLLPTIKRSTFLSDWA